MMWIKMQDDLPGHPKLRRLCRATGWDEDRAIGKLYKLWRWVLKYAEDGNLTCFTSEDIADAMGYTPSGKNDIIEVLFNAGFVDRKPYLRVHDWADYVLKFLQTKYSGTDNDDIPKRVKRLYKSSKTNRSVTGLEHAGNMTEDLPLPLPLNGEQPSSKSGVKNPVESEDTATACSSEPGQVNGTATAPDETAELLAFMRANRPPRGNDMATVDAEAQHEGRTLRSEVTRYQAFGMKALWMLYIKPGHRGFEWAKKRKFVVEEFIRQIPHLVDSDDYPPLKRKFLDETRIPVG